MFDKLFGVINKIEVEPAKAPASKPDNTFNPAKQGKGTSDDRGVMIGYDYLKRQSDAGKTERIQSKLQLLKQLQRELGQYDE